MKISTKGRYALRLMADLAEYNTGENISLKDISARQGISFKYLEQIITLLNRAGFVKSVRGPQGGYRLARMPEEYTVGEILRLTEGSLAPIPCLDGSPNSCERANECAALEMWESLYQAILNVVDHTTLADLMENKRKKTGYVFSI